MIVSHGTRNRMIDRLRRLFGGVPCHVQAAALPWREGEHGIEVMLVTSRETGRWVLPKGWPENDERLSEAAAREAAEEAGLAGAVAGREIGRFYYGKELSSGLRMRCEVRVFPMRVERVADKWPERKKRLRGWFSPAEAASRVREPDLGELIASFADNPRQIVA